MVQGINNKGDSRHSQDMQSGARLLDFRAASRYLSLSYWTMRDMVSRGEIPHVRAGRRVLIDVRDLDRWIDQNKEVWG